MIKQNNCCSFIGRLCGKWCSKKKNQTINPQKTEFVQELSHIETNKIEENKKIVNYTSQIVTGSTKHPISNPSIGHISSDRKSEKIQSPKMNKKEDSVIFYDNASNKENTNNETLIQNLDEAYKIIKDINDVNSFNFHDEKNSEKFTKVIRGFSFKGIMNDENY